MIGKFIAILRRRMQEVAQDVRFLDAFERAVAESLYELFWASTSFSRWV